MKRHYIVNTYALGPRDTGYSAESELYKCYHCTILLTKLNNQNFIFPPVKLKQPLWERGVIFLAVLDRLDPNPYLTQDNSLCT